MTPSPRPSEAPNGHPTLLFDGVCNLCNASVNFIIDRDPVATFRFAALQSDVGSALIATHGLDSAALDSVVLVEGARVYTESTAALRVARRLGLPWSLLWGFVIVPRWIRDPIYRFVARNRYRWFGQSEACRMPTDELRARFLS